MSDFMKILGYGLLHRKKEKKNTPPWETPFHCHLTAYRSTSIYHGNLKPMFDDISYSFTLPCLQSVVRSTSNNFTCSRWSEAGHS